MRASVCVGWGALPNPPWLSLSGHEASACRKPSPPFGRGRDSRARGARLLPPPLPHWRGRAPRGKGPRFPLDGSCPCSRSPVGLRRQAPRRRRVAGQRPPPPLGRQRCDFVGGEQTAMPRRAFWLPFASRKGINGTLGHFSRPRQKRILNSLLMWHLGFVDLFLLLVLALTLRKEHQRLHCRSSKKNNHSEKQDST
ncbi:uncharacterized protein LOC143819124 isoform X2 [Paroedura picta]|uniref:uncharacterized protein LOC143819124 isoform X2 n=1 Tax=Paroedura picta TaxID=143630 RepID=UPI00405677AC